MKRSSTASKSIVNLSPKGLEALSDQLQMDLKTIVEKGVGAALQDFALLFIDLLSPAKINGSYLTTRTNSPQPSGKTALYPEGPRVATMHADDPTRAIFRRRRQTTMRTAFALGVQPV
ncbi:MAG: hypothetical protein K2W95_10225 [Candidatus Obscuribacterales bacterium]|nr:hypothetical protein [Candidatus Obscuribacterales bacterium]